MKRVGIKPKPSFRTDNEHKVDRSHDSINSKLGEEQNTSLKTLSNDRKAEDSENGFHSGIEKDSEAMDRKLKKFLDDDDLMNSYLREEQISSSQSRSRKKISPAILELLEAKKRILTTLWEDSETNWAHRETFMHSHFNDDAHKNFEQISKETMRVFEIRWLDLRIKGLIEQRENSLRSLRNICEKNSLHPKETGYIDCKIFEKLLGDEIVLFRTISLYIIEYIETWKSKQTETDRDVYLFEDNDYILKMATDLKPLVERFSQLFNYLEEKDLNFQSPLFLPKNPRMYFKYYGQRLDKDALDNSDFEENQSIYSKGTSGTLDDGSSFFLTSVKKSSDDFSDEEEEMEIRPTRDTATNRSMRSATSQNTINMLIALNQEIARKAPQTGSFGKVQHFNEETTLLEEDAADLDDDENRLVYNRVMSADKQSDISQPTDLLEQIQVQMQLPPLLVNQAYSDRTKRHKKYTEPLISIRHEDLLEQLERRNPLHYKDLMEKDLIEFSSDLQNNTQEHLSSKKDKELLRSLLSESESNTMDMIQTLDEQTKVHNIDLASTKKVLLKKDKLIQKFKQQEEKNQLNEMYEKMMEEQRAAKAKLEILRKRHIASTYASHSKSQPSITNAPRLKFAPPDPVREMRRLALAEKHIASHERATSTHYYHI